MARTVRVFILFAILSLCLPFYWLGPLQPQQAFQGSSEAAFAATHGRLGPSPPGVGVYHEYFNTTSFMDSGATTASGWGNKSVTATRMFHVQLVGYHATSAPVRELEVQGRKLYFALFKSSDGTPILHIANITDPANMEIMGTRDYPANVTSLTVEGDVLYVGADVNIKGDFFLYNVTDPHTIPTPHYDWNIGYTITGIDVDGHFAYLACYGKGLYIYDVENPETSPRRISFFSLIKLLGLDVEGDFAYLADGTYGLYILNVSQPYSIALAGFVNTPSPANTTGVLVDGNLAYLAEGPGGVSVVDVSDPSSSTLLGRFTTGGNARRLALQGKTLFVADGANGLVILDVANPRHPVYVDRINLPYTWDVDLYGPYVVVGTSSGIYIFNIPGIGQTGISNLPLVGSLSGYKALDVRVRGDVAYVAAGADGLLTVNVSDPSNPVLLDQHKQGSSPYYRKLDVQWPFAFVTNYYYDATWRGVLVYDVSDPTNINLLTRIGFTLAIDVFAWGRILFIADGTYGLYIRNITNLYSSTGVSTISGIGNTTSLWVQGPRLYIVSDRGAYDDGFFVYYLKDLSSPQQTDKVTLWSYFYDIYVDGDTAVTADRDWIIAYNVTDPFNTIEEDFITDFANSTLGVWAFGPYLLQARSTAGVYLINATDIANLDALTYNTGADDARAVTVHGDFAYVANGDSLVIFRLFYSAGATFMTGASTAQSIEVDATGNLIEKATLTADYWTPPGTSITWQMSADGGAHWEAVTPGVEHTFTNPGKDLRWRAALSTPQDFLSPHIYNLTITYTYNDPPTAPTLNDPGDVDIDGNFTVSWSTATDPDGTVAKYQLQMSMDSSFATLDGEWNVTDTSHSLINLASATYYFRVRAVDDDGEPGPWSNTESIRVNAAPTAPTLNDPGDTDDDGAFTVSWSTATDPDGTVAKYQLQMSTSSSFTTITDEWNVTSTSKDVSGLTDGTYYFRVRAIDDDDAPSGWSNIESITVSILTTTTTTGGTPTIPPIPGFPFEAVAVGAAAALALVLVARRRRRKDS